MSIKRLWFPNNPDGKLEIDDRYQLTVGWPLEIEVTTADELTERYLRRYLNDPIESIVTGPQIEIVDIPETTVTRYLRRYLVDPKS